MGTFSFSKAWLYEIRLFPVQIGPQQLEISRNSKEASCEGGLRL